ncbi:MAG: acyl-CoA reductase [Bacteroidia bacterium]|nr:acyl-CoA reductase [Bacteroidia bacterium]MDW8302682.1 acyl-CoA reductase [Bacteroidia bacterium]
MDIIDSLAHTAEYINQHKQADLEQVIHRSYHENGWFIPHYGYQAWRACMQWLDKAVLSQFMQNYIPASVSKQIGIIAAGNIPMVGFHDVLMVILSGHKAIVKLSHQDKQLIPFFVRTWQNLYPEYADKVVFVDDFRQLHLDKVIATGSNNTARYFEYYFRNIPNLIRKNRFSIAVIRGNETEEVLEKLSYDCFDYFGLGCRNISHIFLPQGYEPIRLCPFLERHPHNKYHDKWLNNYTYHKALLLMDLNYDFLDGGFFILREMQPRTQPPAVIGYSFYTSETDLQSQINAIKENLQLILYPEHFGTAQYPAIDDFADNVDTMAFLLAD